MPLSSGSALLDWLDLSCDQEFMAQQKACAEVYDRQVSPVVVCVLALTVSVSKLSKQWVFHTSTAGRLTELAAAPNKVLRENTPPADHMYQDVLQKFQRPCPLCSMV